MPKPWSSDVFITMIIKLLRFAPFPDKTCVAEAIALVHNQEPLSEVTCQAAQKMLLTGLNHYTHPPNPSVPKEKVFIMAALRALRVLGRCDKDFVLEMLAQFLDGDQEIRCSLCLCLCLCNCTLSYLVVLTLHASAHVATYCTSSFVLLSSV